MDIVVTFISSSTNEDEDLNPELFHPKPMLVTVDIISSP